MFTRYHKWVKSGACIFIGIIFLQKYNSYENVLFFYKIPFLLPLETIDADKAFSAQKNLERYAMCADSGCRIGRIGRCPRNFKESFEHFREDFIGSKHVIASCVKSINL